MIIVSSKGVDLDRRHARRAFTHMMDFLGSIKAVGPGRAGTSAAFSPTLISTDKVSLFVVTREQTIGLQKYGAKII